VRHLAIDNVFFRFCKSAKVCITTVSYIRFVLFPFVYCVLSGRKLGGNMQFHCHQHKVTSDELRDLICPDCDDGLDSDNSGVDTTVDYETLIF
jgi:hypothetical protein